MLKVNNAECMKYWEQIPGKTGDNDKVGETFLFREGFGSSVAIYVMFL